jgi:hypothetical protein
LSVLSFRRRPESSYIEYLLDTGVHRHGGKQTFPTFCNAIIMGESCGRMFGPFFCVVFGIVFMSTPAKKPPPSRVGYPTGGKIATRNPDWIDRRFLFL